MKKAQPRKKRQTSAEAARTTKSKSAAKTVHEYIARLPEPAQTKLKQVRAAIRSAVPAETTEVVSYGIPAFKQKRVLVWYAAFADHWSLFPTAAVIEQFRDELKGYTTSKGTIQFPLDKPIPTALIRELVKSRVAGI